MSNFNGQALLKQLVLTLEDNLFDADLLVDEFRRDGNVPVKRRRRAVTRRDDLDRQLRHLIQGHTA